MLQDFDICPVRHTSLIHGLYINLRAIDTLEVNMANQNFPNYGKNDFVRDICSDDYENHIVIENDLPIAVYGISKKPINGMYCIYFLGNKVLDTNLKLQKEFLKRSNAIINGWLSTHECLFNFIHKDNNRSKRWLTSLGAVIHSDITHNGMELFILRKGDANV